ncbi:MAG: amino acid ABC transporter substrate-binding protein [Lachnospiraceae bacterium]|nr:amino acid ABC transporter substrate-binding protein [Lachnospiraceae bacterium]
MKKRVLACLCAVAMLATAMTGCGATEEAAEETVVTEEAGEKSTFTVGFDAEFPPYGYMDENGEYVGFDLDLAAEVCERQGWELVKQPIDWDAKDMELSSGTIDCIWNGFTMNGREDSYTWTVPYVDNSQVFVVAEAAGIATQADLAGKVVGVQKDSSALAALNAEDGTALRDSFAQLIEFADYNTAFMDLEAGAIDAVAMDIGVANYQIESRGGGYVILDEYLATEQYGVGFLLGNEELKNTVETTLFEMKEDGTFDAIAEEWGLTDSVVLGK